MTINFIERLVATYDDLAEVVLIFKASGRGDELVKRNFDLAGMKLVSRQGKRLTVDGCFMDKKSIEPGLEVADLVAHTAGHQRRHELAGKPGFAKDFQKTDWHSPIPPAFMSIDTVHLNELAMSAAPVNTEERKRSP